VQTGRSKQKENFCLGLSPSFLLGLFLEPEVGGSNFLRNVGKLLSHYKASHPSYIHRSNKVKNTKIQTSVIIHFSFIESSN
jgi:hypothetical protein